jgi:hypothetical protein
MSPLLGTVVIADGPTLPAPSATNILYPNRSLSSSSGPLSFLSLTRPISEISPGSPPLSLTGLTLTDTLLACGFPMWHIDTAGEPLDFVAKGLHINPLEFLAIILNVWLALKLISTSPTSATGYIVDLLSDNTSAIS